MSEYAKVEGHSSLIREESSSAIINTDINAYHLAKKRKQAFISQNNEINNLKKDISDIKEMLSNLVERING
jgi:hypothetical protein